MRRPRIKSDGAGYYHCMSRIIERRIILGEHEKAKLLKLMHSLAAFGWLDEFVGQIFNSTQATSVRSASKVPATCASATGLASAIRNSSVP